MKKDKKVLILIICIITILLALLIIFLASSNKNAIDNEETTTTTTTEKVVKEKVLIDELTNVSIKVDDSKYFNNELSIKKLENVKVENIDDKTLLMVYDINLLDENNNIVKVENANLLISIPYNNVNNYTEFKVLHLDENNKVLETLNANYQNGKVVFSVNHLSRYAIVGKKVDEPTTKKTSTQKPNTTQKPTTQQPTTQKPTTQKPTTQPTTQKPTTQPTTKPTTKPTTQPTTQKVKTYTYQWSADGDQGGKYYLYIVDEDGNKVAGTVVLTSKATGSSKTFDIPAAGRLFVKDNYTVSNPKGN